MGILAPAMAFCVRCYSVASGTIVRIAAHGPRIATISPRTAMATLQGAGAPIRGYGSEPNSSGWPIIMKDGKTYITFTGSAVLIKQIEEYKDMIPFVAVIKQVGKYFSFT